MKKLTFAISCYNFGEYIEECLLSALSQKTNFDFDIVVRDDKSTDNSCEVIQKVIDKYSKYRSIRLIRGEVNVGVHENVSSLISECTGEYISLLDGDDYLVDENKIQRQVDFLDKNLDYVMHCTAYRYKDKFGNITPDINNWLCPLKEDVTIEDLLDVNYISFGRLFRNIPEISSNLKSLDYYKNVVYDDWGLNFEILKNGKAKCENYPSGIYRITGSGVMTSNTNEQIEYKNSKCREVLLSEYNRTFKIQTIINTKTIAIVDSFVHSKKVEIKLNECLDRLIEDGIPILLVSNTKVDPEILKKVDYYLYDKRNQLFQNDKYTGVRDVDIFRVSDSFESHEVKSGLQKHGLSVLVNIFNSLQYAKSLGYTHFYRFEVDDDFGVKSRDFIKKVPELVISSNKKAIFYFNEGAFHNGVNDTEPNNVSFHFMFSEIEFFLNSIPKISCELDYENYLMSTKENLDFEIAEEFIYNNLIRVDQSLMIKKSGILDMNLDFPDTEWNKIVSESNMSEKFNGCTTMIYQVRTFPTGVSSILNPYQGEKTNQISILSYNYRDQPIERRIEVIFNDGNRINIVHNLPVNGAWCYNNFDDSVERIKVYENEEFIYEDITNKAKNYIVFK